MYGHVWPCMAMYGHVWPCMAMYGLVWSSTFMYGHVWICIYMHGNMVETHQNVHTLGLLMRSFFVEIAEDFCV